MRPFFTILFCFLSISLFAQYQLRPVTLTDRNDRTTSGFIRYYDWDTNPKFIEFAADSLGPMQSLALRTIQKLTIQNGPFYESLYLKVPYYVKDPIKISEPIIQRLDSTYYLSELLLDSDALKLYRFIDNDKITRFVIEKYDSLVLLDDIHIKVVKKETTYNYNDAVFRKTLGMILRECPTLNLADVTYSESSLINILKEYLSFCRIDSKVYLEQKKIAKTIFGAGIFGSYWKNNDETTALYGLSVQLLLPRQFHNVFAMLNVGIINQGTSPDSKNTSGYFGFFGGRYFGRRAIQGKIYTGLSTLGLLDTGIGLSFKKVISAEIRYPLLSSALDQLHDNSFSARPLLNISAVLPIGRSGNQ